MIEAGAQITYTPDGESSIELAAAGDFFAAPFAVEGGQEIFEAEGVLADESFFRPLGGAAMRISFEVQKVVADRASQQAAHLDELPFTAAGALRVALDGGDYLLFSPAALIASRVSLPAIGGPETSTRWEFIAVPPVIESP